jgi:hypothetical protein
MKAKYNLLVVYTVYNLLVVNYDYNLLVVYTVYNLLVVLMLKASLSRGDAWTIY